MPSSNQIFEFFVFIRRQICNRPLFFLMCSDQIGINAESKKQQRLDYLEEGRKVRQKLEDERLKVEGIKAQKLQGLKDIGIADKYQADLTKKRIC